MIGHVVEDFRRGETPTAKLKVQVAHEHYLSISLRLRRTMVRPQEILHHKFLRTITKH
jgi:hypothetical protein